MSEPTEKRSQPSTALLVECGTCRSSFTLNVALMSGVKRIRIRCRKCGAHIDVDNPGRKRAPVAGKGERPHPATSPPVESYADKGKSGKGVLGMPSTPGGDPPAFVEKGRTGWISPHYTVSRSVPVDPAAIGSNRCVAIDPSAPEVEFYRMLRTKILQGTGGNGGITLMVTSALPGEGKTLTAINLAFTFAKAFSQTALLVDADLRQQKIREILGFSHDKGLADYLLDGCPVSDLMVWPGVEKLTLISGGKTVTESSELLGSPGMAALVAELKERYSNRYVFFDVPPVLSGADALAFAPLVDWILLVVRAESTPLPDVKRALAMLPKEKILGLVLNRDPRTSVPNRKK
jgi:protein-tyrosine kinase